jgi:hypothetical protein
MPKEIVDLEVRVNTSEASSNVKKLKKDVEDTGESTQDAAKDAKKAAGAFGSMGNTLKTLGVVAIISKGFEFFKEVLGKNQKVADALSTTINFFKGVLSDLVSFIVDNSGKVVSFFKDVFENPKQYVIDLAEAIKNNLIERVNSIIDSFGYLGEIIKNVFTGDFDAAIESAKNFGKEMADVVTGVDDSFDKTAKAVTNLAETAGDYFTKKLDQAKALTKSTNDAVIAEARMLNAVKETEIAAEKLRQTRDNENISINERIAANEELGKVLKKGQDQELALVNIRAKKIQDEIRLNGTNNELQAELIKLAGERKDIEEKYTAFASEQLVNRNALLKEQRDIEKSIAENQNKILLDSKKASAELIKDDIERLEVKKQLLKEESDLELKRLQDNINNTKEGTTARAEAEIAYSQKKSEIDIQLATQEDQIALARFNREFSALEQRAANQRLTFDLRKQAIEEEQKQLDDAYNRKLISEKDYNEKTKKLSEDRIATQIAEKEAKASIDQAYLDIASGVASLGRSIFEKNKGVQIAGLVVEQAAAIGKIVSNLGVANLKSASLSPLTAGQPWVTINTIQAGLSIANAIAATAKGISQIRSANASGGAATGSAPSLNTSAPISPTAPIQNTVTQLDQSSINRLGSATNRSYVLESDVSNSQERITRINRAARLN